MDPVERNLTAWAGAYYSLAARWTQAGVPVDLSEWSGELVITTQDVAATVQVTTAATLDDQGNIAVTIGADDLPDLGVWAYRLALTQPAAEDPGFLMVGRFIVKGPENV